MKYKEHPRMDFEREDDRCVLFIYLERVGEKIRRGSSHAHLFSAQDYLVGLKNDSVFFLLPRVRFQFP